MAAHARQLGGLHEQELQEGARALQERHPGVGAAQGLAVPVRRPAAARQAPARLRGAAAGARRPQVHGRHPQGPAPPVPLPRDVHPRGGPRAAGAVLGAEGVLGAEPQGGVLPGAGAGGRLPADAHARRAGLLVPGEHQRQVPQRVLQPRAGGAAARRRHPARAAAPHRARRAPPPAAPQGGARALRHRVVPLRAHPHPALGQPAARLGLLPLRGRQGALQGGARHPGGHAGPRARAPPRPRPLRDARAAAPPAARRAGRGPSAAAHAAPRPHRGRLRVRAPAADGAPPRPARPQRQLIQRVLAPAILQGQRARPLPHAVSARRRRRAHPAPRTPTW